MTALTLTLCASAQVAAAAHADATRIDMIVRMDLLLVDLAADDTFRLLNVV
jgi:hypothetical protein